MSILIKGMEMPKSCCYCPIFKRKLSGTLFCRGKRVAFGKEDAEWLPKTTPNWCPLIPVPDHGRLIDADAAIRYLSVILDPVVAQKACGVIAGMPTIIPAIKEVEA